jgi:hypothetical protein
MKVTNLFTEKDREVFDRIDRDCIAMHVPTPPKTFLKLEVADGAGEVVEVYQDRAHSWVRNGYNVLLGSIGMGRNATGNYGADYTGIKTRSGSVPANSTGILNVANIAVVVGNGSFPYRGIIVGSSATAESFEAFNLGTLISTGASAGQLVYNNQSEPTLTIDGTKATSLHTRLFNNNSGGAIDVNEVGMAFYHASGDVLLCRDVLASTVTVPNAGQLTVTYTIEMTFPE